MENDKAATQGYSDAEGELRVESALTMQQRTVMMAMEVEV
jgi:hypothetical protein